ncbi:MAG: ABC transporter ATP-binding protein [Alphaproteobacteria bacterium]|nr:ABC transporter ATP-binding protein [Alphaproteobacteria bacterium]
MAPLLEVRDLRIEFETEDGLITAVDGVNFRMDAGETLCLVGESGCGKSVSCHAILKLTPPNGRITSGEILFEGRDILVLNEDAMGSIRGREIAMIFQDPLTSLNPLHTIGGQLAESLSLHQGLNRRGALKEAERLLERVGIPDASRRTREYPHQLSGGMNQRVMIAMALACRPKLVIADEPTTALDVTIQAQILDLLKELRDETGLALLLVTHDLGVVAEMADAAAVMYLGRVVEESSVLSLFDRARHPYTHGLMQSVPRVDRTIDRLVPIEGAVPSALEIPNGCSFRPRCPNAQTRCAELEPVLEAVADGHWLACHNPMDAP